MVGRSRCAAGEPRAFQIVHNYDYTSLIGGIAETQEKLDFCGEHGISSDIEMIKIQDIEEAYERMLKRDVE